MLFTPFNFRIEEHIWRRRTQAVTIYPKIFLQSTTKHA